MLKWKVYKNDNKLWENFNILKKVEVAIFIVFLIV